MKALLIIAQGSRSKDSNDEIRRLANRINENVGPAFGLVTSAFLGISSPNIDSAVADLIDEGATEIRVLPYFLSADNHVKNEIPRPSKRKKKNTPMSTLESFRTLAHSKALAPSS